MEFFPLNEAGPAKLRDTTLVMPTVSIGNVGQLAVDLVVTTLGLSRIGYLEEPHVLPCIGNDPFGDAASGEIALNMEVFSDPKGALTVIQQRAPIAPGRTRAFAENLTEWVAETGFKDVIVVSGLDAGKQLTSQLQGQQQVRHISTAEGGDERCLGLGWGLLEEYRRSLHEGDRSVEPTSTSSEHSELEGLEDATWQAGYSFKRASFWKVFEACKAKGIPTLALLLLCSEGDNVADGLAMAGHLNTLLHLLPSSEDAQHGDGLQRWRIPLSWACIYGPPPDDTLY